ncbi:hypothetical protein FHL15_003419 [Xylaria flabelliformis]|uniref:Uncharacterized protein n=1 Tax=Xylaria flabelliformis TaxID=2512241 RepID=A0A553I6M7_9PEZI|nr:hypothetical protein FHL15_003419 [Xylaria flabelliformis]
MPLYHRDFEEMGDVFTPSSADFRKYALEELDWFFRCVRKRNFKLKKPELEASAQPQSEATNTKHSPSFVELATSRKT